MHVAVIVASVLGFSCCQRSESNVKLLFAWSVAQKQLFEARREQRSLRDTKFCWVESYPGFKRAGPEAAFVTGEKIPVACARGFSSSHPEPCPPQQRFCGRAPALCPPFQRQFVPLLTERLGRCNPGVLYSRSAFRKLPP